MWQKMLQIGGGQANIPRNIDAIPYMTSNNAPSGTITYSGLYNYPQYYQGYYAFRGYRSVDDVKNDGSKMWGSNYISINNYAWIKYTFDSSIDIENIFIQCASPYISHASVYKVELTLANGSILTKSTSELSVKQQQEGIILEFPRVPCVSVTVHVRPNNEDSGSRYCSMLTCIQVNSSKANYD